jgi:hypothetical protein
MIDPEISENRVRHNFRSITCFARIISWAVQTRFHHSCFRKCNTQNILSKSTNPFATDAPGLLSVLGVTSSHDPYSKTTTGGPFAAEHMYLE